MLQNFKITKLISLQKFCVDILVFGGWHKANAVTITTVYPVAHDEKTGNFYFILFNIYGQGIR
jgi:hypothetical protein